jgi:tetratricopeptide (TPR) repeat protein
VAEARGGVVPDPGDIHDLAEFIEALNLLRAASGNPSFRVLAKLVGARLRPPQVLAHTTVRDLFQVRRRRLDIDLLTATVRALGLSDAEAARWRRACVRIQVEAKIGGMTAVRHQLPPETAVFTGRQRELDALLKSAEPQAGRRGAGVVAVSAIEGMAGVGKTQLALRAAHEMVRAGRFADAQLYMDLRGFDPSRPPADVLDSFLRRLGVASQHVPEKLDERAAMFRDRMHGRDALILLDNAASEDQVRDLIPASPSCLVLITSRRSLAGLDGASLYTLDVFSPAEAIILLAAIAGDERIEAEPEAAAAIVEACGHLPLAVALAGSRLRARPAWTLADLARRLRMSGLDGFSAGNRALRPVLDLSYRGLLPSARFVFCVLGLHAGADISAAAVAAAGGISRTETERILERLQDEHLLQSMTGDRYRFHDLIRGYAAEMADRKLDPDQRRTVSHRLIDWYLEGADEARRLLDPGRDNPLLDAAASPSAPSRFTGSDDAMRWCDDELDNLRACTQFAIHARHSNAVWQLPVALLSYYQLRGRWDEAEQTHREALEHVRANAPDTAVEALLLRGLGAAARGQGRPDLAKQIFRQILTLTEQGELPVDRGYAFHNLSIIDSDDQRYAESVENSRRALELFRSASDRYGQALSHSFLAASLNALGDYSAALEHGQAAFDLASAIASVMLQGRAASNLAASLYFMKEYHRALAKGEEALVLVRRSGYLWGEASLLFDLGSIHHALHHLDEAREHFNRSLDILRGIGEPGAAFVEARIASLGMQADEKSPEAPETSPGRPES